MEKPKKAPEPRFVCEHPKPIRRAFLCRIYGLAIVQLALIAVCVMWATSGTSPLFEHEDADGLLPEMNGHPWVFASALAVVLLLLIVMSCWKSLTQLFPLNLFLLLLFAVAVAYMIASIADAYNRLVVMHTLLIILLILVALMIYCALPGFPRLGYSFLVASLFILVVIVLVAAVLIVAEPEEFLWNWQWLKEKDAWKPHGAAYNAAGAYVALAGALVFSIYLQFILYGMTQTKEPWDYISAAFWFNANAALVAGTSMGLVGSTMQKGASVVGGMVSSRRAAAL
jgi:FtsH-binding integral membrane protein